MAQSSTLKSHLRRSFSEHVKDSTNKAWEVLWRAARERRLWEIEATEACDWLRAAGFPQYAHLFKDCRFPVDIERAKRDHDFLDQDAVDSLCRRLVTLNKCVDLRLEPRRSKLRVNECDDEDFCAISPNWTFDRRARQWRRLDAPAGALRLSDDSRDVSACDGHDACSLHSSSSMDSDGHDGRRRKEEERATSGSSSRRSSTNKPPSLDTSFSGPPSPGGATASTISLEADGALSDKPPRRRCTTLLRKMERLRLRGARGPRSEDHGLVLVQEEDRTRRPLGPTRLQARPDSAASSSSPHATSSSSSQSESSSTVSTPSPVTRVRSNCKRSGSTAGVGGGATPNNQNHTGGQEDYQNQINNNHDSLVFQIPDGHKPGTFPTLLAHKHAILSPIIHSTSVNWRTGSFHGYRAPSSCRRGTSTPAGAPASPPPPPPPPPPSSSSLSCGRVGVRSPLAALDHRLSVYDNVPDDPPLAEGEGAAGRKGAEPEAGRIMAGEDVFAALDGVLERISDLQQLVTSWSENLSEDDCQRGSSSSSSSSSSSTSSSSSSSSSSQDSPARGSSPSSPGHIHLEVQRQEESGEEGGEPKRRSLRSRTSRQLHWSSEQSLAPPGGPMGPPGACGAALEALSASQFVLLQKLSLLRLTTLMDKHSPCSKQGWNWTVPKPPRKNKVVDPKGREVFGVPLLVSAQKTGEPLPPAILGALVYLRTECLDQVGLFRKSGVKSRIQLLREQVESDPDRVSYAGQSAFDVADLVKQYFRDLPEPVFTSRLCESFLHIFQYFPKDQQLCAAQAAVLLLPDENREALRTLFLFLRDVTACVDENQMTPTNVAVCLAPSLFHLNTVKRDGAAAGRSGHRKFSLGRPDQRDLSETLAATQGLATMISEAPKLFQLPDFWPAFSSEESLCEEVEVEERRSSRLQRSTQLLLKEAQERSRGWESRPGPEEVELAFRRVEDGAPPWAWRGSVEVEAPPPQVLHRLLRERPRWERRLHHGAVVQTLSEDAEVYRYIIRGRGHSLGSLPPREHLLLRTWQADPSSGPLYLSSVSTEHPAAPPDGVRVHVHGCLFLLEPAGAGRTRLTHVCRTDTRGRSPEWHSRVGGALLASELLAIRNSFSAEHKETKV